MRLKWQVWAKISKAFTRLTHFDIILTSNREPLKCLKQEGAIIRFPFQRERSGKIYRTDFTEIKLDSERQLEDYFKYLGQKLLGGEPTCWCQNRNGDELDILETAKSDQCDLGDDRN